MSLQASISVTLEFSGGVEQLFHDAKKIECQLENPPHKWTVRNLLPWMKDKFAPNRPDLIFQGDSVRPGILVLINDTDWELMGELDYEIQSNDKILFISTLHGG